MKKTGQPGDSSTDSQRREEEIPAATIVGPDLVLCGELVSEENIRVRGRVEGNISTSGSLIIEPSGNVKGDITAENVVVEGSVEGTVIAALKFELRPSGWIQGDIRASVVSGGVLCVVGVLVCGALLPKFVKYDARQRARDLQLPAAAGTDS